MANKGKAPDETVVAGTGDEITGDGVSDTPSPVMDATEVSAVEPEPVHRQATLADCNRQLLASWRAEEAGSGKKGEA